MRRQRLLWLSTAWLALVLAPCAPASEVVETNLAHEQVLEQGQGLMLENLLGSIRVLPSQTPGVLQIEARVVAEAADWDGAVALAESIRLLPSTDGDKASIHVAFPVDQHTLFRPPKAGVKGWVSKWVTPLVRKATVATQYGGESVEIGPTRGAASVAVDIDVRLPLDVAATFRQVVGSIEVQGLRGGLRLETVEGHIEADQIYGSLDVRTGGGELTISKFRGESFNLHSGSGSIQMNEIDAVEASLRSNSGAIYGTAIRGGILRADTRTGSVKLDELETGRIDVVTISGAVDLATRFKNTKQAHIESESGGVVLRVGQFGPFQLQTAEAAGSIKAKGIAVDVERGPGGKITRLSRGSGGAQLEVVTSGGPVVLRPL